MRSLLRLLIVLLFTSPGHGQTRKGVDLYFAFFSLQQSQESALLPQQLPDGRFHYVDVRNGTEVVPGTFDIAYPFCGISAVVAKDGKYGIINKNGEWLVPATYSYFRRCTEQNQVTLYSNDSELTGSLSFELMRGYKTTCAICLDYVYNIGTLRQDENGQYRFLSGCDTCYAAEVYDTLVHRMETGAYSYSFFVLGSKGRFGIVDPKGKVLVPFHHKYAQHISNGVAALSKGRRWTYFILRNKVLKAAFNSKYTCLEPSLLRGSVGIIQKRNGPSLLFADGSTLPGSYGEFIGGLLARKGKQWFIILPDKTAFPYLTLP